MSPDSGLPPHLVTLRPATDRDAAFVTALTRQTMEPLVRQTWPDAAAVARYFAANGFDRDVTHIIQRGGVDVGRISLLVSATEVYVDQVHVLPQFQGHGLGSAVLARVIARAQAAGQDVRLQCLRVNPAAALYRRLGFAEYAASDTHFFLRIAAHGSAHAAAA